MSRPVHIVAVAARTPVGLRAETSAAAVRAGISRVMDHPFMVDPNGEFLRCGLDQQLPAGLLGPARLVSLLDAVMAELSDKLAAYSPPITVQVPCWLALPCVRPGFLDSDAREVQRLIATRSWPGLGPQGKPMWRTAMQGHAGAVLGFDRAMREVSAGGAELCLVAGVDTYFDADTVDWLDADRRLLRDGVRGAFPPGEGAAALALASDATRRALRLPSLAVVEAVAYGTEQGDENSDEGIQGVAFTDVFSRIGAGLASGARFDDVFIDINDERTRTTDYAFALLRNGALFRDGSQYTTSVGKTGELGAASAAFNCILAVCSFARGYARGEHALVASSSWNGLRGAILLGRGRG